MEINELVSKIIEYQYKLKDTGREMYCLNTNIVMVRDPLTDGEEPVFDREEAFSKLRKLHLRYNSRKETYQALFEMAKFRKEELRTYTYILHNTYSLRLTGVLSDLENRPNVDSESIGSEMLELTKSAAAILHAQYVMHMLDTCQKNQ